MAQYQGKVSKIFPSRFGGAFGLDGQYGIYFNTKDALPAFVTEGATVAFDGQMQRNGKSFSVTDTTLVAIAAPPSSPASSKQSGPSNYAETQSAIRYQAARKDALVMVDLLIRNGAIGLGKTDSKKAGIIEDAVDRFTAVYYEDTGTLGALERTPAPELPAPSAKSEAPSESLPE